MTTTLSDAMWMEAEEQALAMEEYDYLTRSCDPLELQDELATADERSCAWRREKAREDARYKEKMREWCIYSMEEGSRRRREAHESEPLGGWGFVVGLVLYCSFPLLVHTIAKLVG